MATFHRPGSKSNGSLVTKVPKRRREHFRGGCQEEHEEEGTVKMNKSKAEQSQSAVGVTSARRVP